MNYQGKITHILPLEHVGANQLAKRTIILEEATDKEWKGGLAVDFLKDKTELVNDVQVGDIVDCSLNFRVNEYNGRRYNWVTCWKMEKKWWAAAPDAPLPDNAAEWFQGETYSDELPF